MVNTAQRLTFHLGIVATLLAAVLAVPFADSARAQAASTTADEAAIAEFNRLYLKAINDGDIDTLARLTTEGHMMIASGGPPLVGKKALVEAMTRAFETTDIDETWAPEETVVSGDLAYQRGTFVVVVKPKNGGAETRLAGNFLRIYRKIGGAWLMVRDSFNSQQPRAPQ
jgi:ketosteroid isomerase-like protein